ncbi:MAG: IS4 family transposase [Cyclobacterium sp.]|nr:IS4 family transposase [Cyclobacterium sp.]
MERIARKTGFVQRKGKICPKSFFMSVLFQCFTGNQTSLNDHLVDLMRHHNVKVRKQSLFERFNSKAVAFLKHLLEEQLKLKWSCQMPWENLERFTEVLIEDSVRFQLPDHLKDSYPGNGGGASQAGAHLQFEFDLKSGNVKTLSLHHAKYQDQKAARDQVDRISENSLIIRDLGYFVMDILESIHRKGAFFISRLKPKTTIYELKEGQYIRLVDINSLYAETIRSKIPYLEKQVHMGPKKIPVRLLLEPLPEAVVEERLRKANKQAVKKGRNVSKEYKAFLRLNLFITNVPSEDLAIEQVHQLYRLRWQVELVFKTWKGYFKFHQFKEMQLHRFECYIFASLLFILSGWELYCRLAGLIWQERHVLVSKMKFAKAWIQNKPKWRQLLSDGSSQMEDFIKDIRSECLDFLLQERRKNRYNLEEFLQVNTCK